MQLASDEAIRRRYGPHGYPNPFPPGTFMAKDEDLTNAFRDLWASILVSYARLLRRAPFFS